MCTCNKTNVSGLNSKRVQATATANVQSHHIPLAALQARLQLMTPLLGSELLGSVSHSTASIGRRAPMQSLLCFLACLVSCMLC